MLALNESGGRVWEALEQERSSGDLARAAEFGASAATTLQHVEVFLQDLEREGVVAAIPTASGRSADAPISVLADAPAITWREKITRCASGCGTHPGQSDVCNTYPYNS